MDIRIDTCTEVRVDTCVWHITADISDKMHLGAIPVHISTDMSSQARLHRHVFVDTSKKHVFPDTSTQTHPCRNVYKDISSHTCLHRYVFTDTSTKTCLHRHVYKTCVHRPVYTDMSTQTCLHRHACECLHRHVCVDALFGTSTRPQLSSI